MNYKRPRKEEVKKDDKLDIQRLDEDLRRLELSQFRVIRLKYPKETEKIMREEPIKTA